MCTQIKTATHHVTQAALGFVLVCLGVVCMTGKYSTNTCYDTDTRRDAE